MGQTAIFALAPGIPVTHSMEGSHCDSLLSAHALFAGAGNHRQTPFPADCDTTVVFSPPAYHI